MCGRYSFFATAEQLAGALGHRVNASGLDGPRYNAAPTQLMPVLVGSGVAPSPSPAWQLKRLRFGWPAGPGGRPPALINARGETVHQLPMYRQAFVSQRCVVLASGFYEWAAGPRPRQPWFFSPNKGPLWGLAAIWRPEGFVIITRPANATVGPVHPRMPQILPRNLWRDYLQAPAATARSLLQPTADSEVAAWPVSRAVNSPSYGEPSCIAREGS